MAAEKIARICWNTQGWRKPSGQQGKSKNKKAYEFKVRYGDEEWLLDITKLIEGWHYAALQPIGLHRDKYIGETFNISLYSINEETKGRWWVGRIPGVEVVSSEDARKVYGLYKRRVGSKKWKPNSPQFARASTLFGASTREASPPYGIGLRDWISWTLPFSFQPMIRL